MYAMVFDICGHSYKIHHNKDILWFMDLLMYMKGHKKQPHPKRGVYSPLTHLKYVLKLLEYLFYGL